MDTYHKMNTVIVELPKSIIYDIIQSENSSYSQYSKT